MTQVPEKVLSWLYGVLHEYRDPQRTYSDTARALSAQASLSPRTEVYTYDNGSPALLVTLSGTLPVGFRGTTYRFPVKLWIPQSYPQEPPMVYVTPGRDMLVRPGQHVGVDGRVYHPYLRDWGRMWDRASITEFLELLQQVFAKEPPVISKAQQQQYQRPIGQTQQSPAPGGDLGPPRLPPKQQIGTAEQQQPPNGDAPPPRPPKPGDESANTFPARTSSRNIARDGPPPPPLPHEMPPTLPHQQRLGSNPSRGPPSNLRISSPQPPAYSNGSPSRPPIPQMPQVGWQQPGLSVTHQQSTFERSPVSPLSPTNVNCESTEHKYSNQAPTAPSTSQPQLMPPQGAPNAPPPQYQQHYAQQPSQQLPPQQQQQHQYYQPQQRQSQFPPQPQPPKQPPPDLLSDPFDVALPNPATLQSPTAPPPIPPNPEKEHLLSAITTTLVPQAQQRISQNLSFLAPLQAQHAALSAAHNRLQADLQTLQRLDAALDSNEAILRQSIKDCDATIAAAREKPPPPVDEVLIAPTMVANQLWTLCAEEVAVREAMYFLQKAVDRGRVGGNEFVRNMRSLGRERFLKMVLARKCARGLGLEVGGSGHPAATAGFGR